MFNNKIAEIIRVNHAGERGAKVIYQGQITALKLKGDITTLKLVEEMRAQEIEHFEYFDNEIKTKRIRPTLMQPVWEVGGFALGFITALIDKKSAMVCTTAVEEVIDKHYQEQIKDLEKICENTQKIFTNTADDEKNRALDSIPENLQSKNAEIKNLKILQQNIQKFRDDEIHHRDIAYDNHARDFVAYQPLSNFIKFATKLAIKVSKRV